MDERDSELPVPCFKEVIWPSHDSGGNRTLLPAEKPCTQREQSARADPEQCCWGVPELLGGASSTARSAVEQVRPRQREALAEGAAAGVWGRKNRSPRVLECT